MKEGSLMRSSTNNTIGSDNCSEEDNEDDCVDEDDSENGADSKDEDDTEDDTEDEDFELLWQIGLIYFFLVTYFHFTYVKFPLDRP